MPYSGPDSYGTCERCGKRLSNRGLAIYSHRKWHERQDAKAKEQPQLIAPKQDLGQGR